MVSRLAHLSGRTGFVCTLRVNLEICWLCPYATTRRIQRLGSKDLCTKQVPSPDTSEAVIWSVPDLLVTYGSSAQFIVNFEDLWPAMKEFFWGITAELCARLRIRSSSLKPYDCSSRLQRIVWWLSVKIYYTMRAHCSFTESKILKPLILERALSHCNIVRVRGCQDFVSLYSVLQKSLDPCEVGRKRTSSSLLSQTKKHQCRTTARVPFLIKLGFRRRAEVTPDSFTLLCTETKLVTYTAKGYCFPSNIFS